MTPSAGDIWIADRGGEVRHEVVVLSDRRFHQLAERAIIAPVDPTPATERPPWYIDLADGRSAALHLVGSIPVARLLERVDWIGDDALRRAQRALRAMTGM